MQFSTIIGTTIHTKKFYYYIRLKFVFNIFITTTDIIIMMKGLRGSANKYRHMCRRHFDSV